jgi:hypothetical protein
LVCYEFGIPIQEAIELPKPIIDFYLNWLLWKYSKEAEALKS